jgi:hypothetical protein
MAIFVFKEAFLSIAASDLSDHVKSVTLNTGIETGDKTAMGNDTRQMKGGLKTWSITAAFHQDFAAGELDAVIAALTNNEAALEVRPTDAAVSTTNPKWTGTGLLTAYTPFGGSVGDTPAEASVTFEAASDLTRATA